MVTSAVRLPVTYLLYIVDRTRRAPAHIGRLYQRLFIQIFLSNEKIWVSWSRLKIKPLSIVGR